MARIYVKNTDLKGVRANAGGLSTSAVYHVLVWCVSVCVYVCFLLVILELFDVIMSFPRCIPVCFSPSSRFSIMSTFFILNKRKHTFPHNRILNRAICPWMDLLERLNVKMLCVCVCVFEE